jgi:phage terminase large subunit-like protein
VDTAVDRLRIADPYNPGANAETFDFPGWVAGIDARLLDGSPEYSDARIEATRLDPLLFAVLFCLHHLRDPEGQVSFADAHLEWVRIARQWVIPPAAPMEQRDGFLAPRDTGKSTWMLFILPLWAAAHEHVKFAAVFADSGPQAEMHLATFRKEVDQNAALRRDFPKLCAAGRRPSGASESDAKHMVIRGNGFVFAAKGIDSSSLGMKVGERRPDLLLLDDVEPDEAMYSAYQAGKRLKTITDAILPLNIYARVVLSGTVTMPGSVTHQLVRWGKGERDDVNAWVGDEKFRVHHHLPIEQREDGTERSVWPQKWPLSYLTSIRHTRAYAKNMANDPLAADGALWTPDDFRYPGDEGSDPITHMMLSIDPAVTAKKSSDFTGLAVVAWSAQTRRCTVHAAWALKVTPGPLLRDRVLAILDEYPQIGLILVEVNQGGDTWQSILHGMPVKVKPVNQNEPKFARAEGVLNHYQRGRVLHARRLPELEQQMCTFPKGANDDMVDAVGSAVRRFLNPPKKTPATATRASYA